MAGLPTVMLVGLGHLGGPLLDALARSPRVGRVVAVSRSAESGQSRCNLARLSAVAGGVDAKVEHRITDVSVPEQVRLAVRETAPDLILYAASMQTWWLGSLFEDQARAQLARIGFGAWISLHLSTVVPFVAGVEAAGFSGVVLNAAYPDVVNVVLERIGRPVTAGVGNVDELVAKLEMKLMDALGAGHDDLEIHLVAHHSLQRVAFASAAEGAAYAPAGGRRSVPGEQGGAISADLPPFYLRVFCRGEDVTESAETAVALLGPCPLPEGPGWGTFSAASAVRCIEELLSTTGARLHLPGPAGLPGGYPVDVEGGRPKVAAIPGLTLEEAIDINERSHRFDGIERVDEDGTVVFTTETAARMRETLGFDCPKLAPEDATSRAVELAGRFAAYAERHGVDLAAAGLRRA